MKYNEILNSEQSKYCNVIYKFTNLINGKVYIGQTRKQFRERLANHIWQMKNKPSYFHKALLKYGLSNFDIKILERCDNPEDLNGLEIYWIDYFDSTNKDKGYNLTKGGNGIPVKVNKMYEITEESKEKRSKSAKEKWKNQEYRQRYKQSRKDYIKVVKLTLDDKLVEIYPTFADAEKSLFGKRNSYLWYKLRKNNQPFVIVQNFKWMLLETFNTQLGKQKISKTKRKV